MSKEYWRSLTWPAAPNEDDRRVFASPLGPVADEVDEVLAVGGRRRPLAGGEEGQVLQRQALHVLADRLARGDDDIALGTRDHAARAVDDAARHVLKPRIIEAKPVVATAAGIDADQAARRGAGHAAIFRRSDEVGLIKNGETFVLLDYRMFSKLVTVKALTKDGIIGWIDVDQFSIKPYDEISSR